MGQKMDMECRICGSYAARRVTAREMMLGLRESFDYAECADCGCLQICEVPEDLGRFYDAGYYSIGRANPLVLAAKEERLKYITTGRGMLGRLVCIAYPRDKDARIAPKGVTKNSRLLEVGCGNGYYLLRLLELGYTHLWGVDPFMDSRSIRDKPLRLEQRTLLDIDPAEGPVDTILFYHSFEHIPQQHETLERAHQLLAPGGVCLIAIPTVSSWAWEHYGTDWVQLDAPRHLYLHSRRSLSQLAERHGFVVDEVSDNSNAFQFWGSELYRADIPLRSDAAKRAERQGKDNPDYMSRAEQLNREGRGDQFVACLRKA
jgi:SAM-dependent methyltransferase